MGDGVNLHWLPLGAGGRVVRRCGQAYEWVVSRRQHRRAVPLYHSALVVCSHGTRHAIEVGPVWELADTGRGVVREGPVGGRLLGRSRAFRYEVRCWAGGRVPDLGAAVGGPVEVATDPARVAALLAVLPQVPPLTWGRDELGTGEMWNSNSVIAWALVRSGHHVDELLPPPPGRAPGWDAGLVLARAQLAGSTVPDAAATASPRPGRR